MSGLINDQPAAGGDQPTGDDASQPDNAAQTPGSSSLENPLLQQAENGIEAKLTPQNRADYTKIVVAGLHIALAKGPNSRAAMLLHSPDPIGMAAKGAVALIFIMRKMSTGTMPMQAAIPAGLTLVLHALDFLDHAGVVKIAEPEIVRATTIYTNVLFQRMGITPKMLQNATGNVHQIITDPNAMNKIQLKAGLLKAPGAATPADIPGIPTGSAINPGAGG